MDCLDLFAWFVAANTLAAVAAAVLVPRLASVDETHPD